MNDPAPTTQRSASRGRRLADLALLLTIVVVLFEPLFLDRSLLSFDNRLVAPFCVRTPAGVPAQPMNLVTSDLNGWILPETYLIRERLRAAELPLWNERTISASRCWPISRTRRVIQPRGCPCWWNRSAHTRGGPRCIWCWQRGGCAGSRRAAVDRLRRRSWPGWCSRVVASPRCTCTSRTFCGSSPGCRGCFSPASAWLAIRVCGARCRSPWSSGCRCWRASRSWRSSSSIPQRPGSEQSCSGSPTGSASGACSLRCSRSRSAVRCRRSICCRRASSCRHPGAPNTCRSATSSSAGPSRRSSSRC